MFDFSQDDLFEAADKAVADALARAGFAEPPVDTLDMAESAFGFAVEYVEPDDEEPRYGARPRRRPGPNTIALREDQSDEGQQAVAAKAVAGRLLPAVLTKLGIAPGTESRQAKGQLVGLLAARLLLPTRWFSADARRAGFDLLTLKEQYPTATYETIAWRMLDVADDPLVIAFVDDGLVSARRANRFPATKKLTAAEQRVVDKVSETEEPAKARADEWTAVGWPVQGIPYRRIIVRAAPDDV